MHRRQELIAVAEMVLADLRRGIAVRLEQFGDGRVLVLQALLGCGHPDFQQAGAERRLSQDKGGTPGGAGLLGVVVGEKRALSGDAVDVGRGPAHHAAMVGTDIPDADIVGHDHDDVGLLGRRLRRRGAAERERDRYHRSREIIVFDHRLILPFAFQSGNFSEVILVTS
jgi:hypothetical protein